MFIFMYITLLYGADVLKERPFNLKGEDYGLFLKNILIPNVAEKKYCDFDSEFLSYNLMLNSGGKNNLTLMLSKK